MCRIEGHDHILKFDGGAEMWWDTVEYQTEVFSARVQGDSFHVRFLDGSHGRVMAYMNVGEEGEG